MARGERRRHRLTASGRLGAANVSMVILGSLVRVSVLNLHAVGDTGNVTSPLVLRLPESSIKYGDAVLRR